jgi:hypothetical protein
MRPSDGLKMSSGTSGIGRPVSDVDCDNQEHTPKGEANVTRRLYRKFPATLRVGHFKNNCGGAVVDRIGIAGLDLIQTGIWGLEPRTNVVVDIATPAWDDRAVVIR